MQFFQTDYVKHAFLKVELYSPPLQRYCVHELPRRPLTSSTGPLTGLDLANLTSQARTTQHIFISAHVKQYSSVYIASKQIKIL